MASEIGIANSALIQLGAKPIMSLSDSNINAERIASVIEMVREEVLAVFPWNCATKQQALAMIDSTPLFGWDYAYQLPTDCLRVIKMQDDDYTYSVQSGMLLTDQDEAIIEYIWRNTNYGTYPPHLASSIASRLAAEIAFAVTASLQKEQAMYQVYTSKLEQAKGLDYQEGIPELEEIESSWISKRTA